ncbi:MAG: Gfo/Idh/MocA family oxidoreductase [Acidobacteriota bacterium]
MNSFKKGKAGNMDRRSFLKKSSLIGAGVVMSPLLAEKRKQPFTKPGVKRAAPMDIVRIGFVGVGGMGTAHCKNLLNIEGAEIRAVCDIVPEKVENIQKLCLEKGFGKPDAYTRGEYDYKRMCERDDLDLIMTATPWKWHVPVAVEAMKSGKHTAIEVPAALTIDECWDLVETAEKEEKYCVMLENCNYDKTELTVLNMARKGMFGELIHGAAGYLHDLRGIKFSNKGEGLWRLDHSVKRDGNLYPTHGLGPVAEYMDINRGNIFEYLVSMSSKSRGLNEFAAEKFGKDSPQALQKYVLGDVNVSLIKTSNGETITLYHDTNLPRPYSRINEIQGTKGIFQDYPPQIYIEGLSETHDRWEPLEKYYDEYLHPLWREMEESTKDAAGHGGMDYLEDFRLVDALRKGRLPDMDVYDAVALSVVTELSEISVRNNGKPVKFPDFTRGAWKTNERIFLTDYKY